MPSLTSPGRSGLTWVAGSSLAVVTFVTLFAWALSSPVGSSPDDDFHLASIWCGWGDDANLCQDLDEPNAKRVPLEVAQPACFAFDTTKSGECKADFIGREGETATSGWGNFNDLYPPVYYAAMRTFVSDDVTASVLRIRVANAALSVLVVGAVALLVPLALRRTMLWALLLTTVPLGAFILGSNNPSAWAILSAGTLWVALYAMFDAQGRRRAALGVASVVTALMGSGARADACLYSSLAVCAVMVLRWGVLRRNAAPVAIGAGIVAVSAWFFLTSGQGQAASAGLPTAPGVGPEVSIFELTVHNLLELPWLLFGSFGSGSLGWLDTSLPPLVFYCSILAAAVVLFWGWSSMNGRKLIAVSGVAVCLVAFPLLVLAQNRHTVGMAVQPRYLLPMIVLLAGLSLLRVDGRLHPLNTFQRGAVGASLVVAHSVALHTNMRRYTTGSDENGVDLNTGAQWWWDTSLQPMTVWVVGSLAFAAAAVLVLGMRDEASEEEPVVEEEFVLVDEEAWPAQAPSLTRAAPAIQ